jgi:hypothetical protein
VIPIYLLRGRYRTVLHGNYTVKRERDILIPIAVLLCKSVHECGGLAE